MDASIFWKIIGEYNQDTLYLQIGLLVLLLAGVSLSYLSKKGFIAKLVLGIENLFIAFGFFLAYGTQAIQKYFAFPLFLMSGILFIYEAIVNKDDQMDKPDVFAIVLMMLYVLYPAISLLLGSSFPEMVTHIMPCPIATISLAIYSCYGKRNKVLWILLTIWGLTGIKSVIFAAYEDIVLLLAGIYGVYMMMKKKI